MLLCKNAIVSYCRIPAEYIQEHVLHTRLINPLIKQVGTTLPNVVYIGVGTLLLSDWNHIRSEDKASGVGHSDLFFPPIYCEVPR